MSALFVTNVLAALTNQLKDFPQTQGFSELNIRRDVVGILGTELRATRESVEHQGPEEAPGGDHAKNAPTPGYETPKPFAVDSQSDWRTQLSQVEDELASLGYQSTQENQRYEAQVGGALAEIVERRHMQLSPDNVSGFDYRIRGEGVVVLIDSIYTRRPVNVSHALKVAKSQAVKAEMARKAYAGVRVLIYDVRTHPLPKSAMGNRGDITEVLWDESLGVRALENAIFGS